MGWYKGKIKEPVPVSPRVVLGGGEFALPISCSAWLKALPNAMAAVEASQRGDCRANVKHAIAMTAALLAEDCYPDMTTEMIARHASLSELNAFWSMMEAHGGDVRPSPPITLDGIPVPWLAGGTRSVPLLDTQEVLRFGPELAQLKTEPLLSASGMTLVLRVLHALLVKRYPELTIEYVAVNLTTFTVRGLWPDLLGAYELAQAPVPSNLGS